MQDVLNNCYSELPTRKKNDYNAGTKEAATDRVARTIPLSSFTSSGNARTIRTCGFGFRDVFPIKIFYSNTTFSPIQVRAYLQLFTVSFEGLRGFVRS